jgi:holo-[acyl-carrier protein] synthase
VVVGLGVDVFEVPRMDEELRRDSAVALQLFSPEEITYCDSQRYPAQHYAVRFAAKEAVFKALGVDAGAAPRWRDVEVVLTPGGGREVALHGTLKELAERRGVRRMHLSLSHTRALAMAGVILES